MPRRPAFDPTVRLVAPLLPAPLVERWARAVLCHRHVALCLHRVDAPTASAAAEQGLSIPSGVLDELIERAARIGGGRRWLTLSFDDGYLDAVRYVGRRMAAHPEIEWRVFACPDKAARRSGFRWDAGLDAVAPLPSDQAALLAENTRAELACIADQAGFELATLDELRALRHDAVRYGAGPDVVGNHTSAHLPLALLPAAVAEVELARSVADFATHLGVRPEGGASFAFPFGAPGHHWRPEHAELLRDEGVTEIWSVQSRTFAPADRFGPGVLPRFPVDGRDPATAILALVAARATAERVLERRPRRRPTARRAGTAPPATPAAPVDPWPDRIDGYRHDSLLVHLGGPSVETDGVLEADAPPPVVLVHGASGHVESFRYLAQALAGRRAVYGLRASGVLAGEELAAGGAELVAAGLDAVKQLGRPVELAGYSLGGIIALRLAAELEPVGLLAGPVRLIDAYRPSLEVLPMPQRLRHAARFARRHGLRSLAPWAGRLGGRHLRQLRRTSAPAPDWLEPLGFGDVAALGLVDRETEIRAMGEDLLTMVPYRGAVRSVRSLDLAPNLPADAGLGHCTTQAPDERLVAGDHFSMLAPAHVHDLLAALGL